MNIRKLMILLICCTILFTASSCTSSSNKLYDENSTADPSESSGTDIHFDTYLYGMVEDNYILNEHRSTAFDTCEYTDAKAEQNKTLTVCGIKYSMTYENSAILPMSDFAIHTYKIDGLENARVLVNAMDGSVIKYINIPYTQSLSTEEDYLEFIQAVHPSSDYSEYGYKCTTHCYYISDSEIRSAAENGFLLKNENRKIKAYYFYFTQSIGSIETDNHISAIFNTDTFTLEVYDIDYSMDVVRPLLGVLSKLENSLSEYVRANLKVGIDFYTCDVGRQRLFVKDGIPYILTSLSVTFTRTDNQDSTLYTTNLQLISGMSNQ